MVSPQKKAKAKAARDARNKYPPGTSARLPRPYAPAPDVQKWLATASREFAEDACAEALARKPIESCLAPDWRSEFERKDAQYDQEWPAPPGGYKAPVVHGDAPRETRCFGDVDPSKHRGFLSRRALAKQFDGINREWFPEKGDQVEVHTHGVWRKGSVRNVDYGRLCPGRPADVRYAVHLESEGVWLPSEIDHLKRVFKRVDEDGSGEIDREELQKLLIELEHPLASDDYCVDDLFRRTDKDKSGLIDFKEFCDLVYVELHDDIGLPHTLYDVSNGVPHRKLRRRPWKFGHPQNIFATKRGPLKTLLENHRKGSRIRKKAFQRARTDTICLPVRTRAKAHEPPARQFIANREEAKKALCRDPFHPRHRDRFCKKERRYAAKVVEAAPTYTVTVRDNFLGGFPVVLPDRCFDGLNYPLETSSYHRHVHGKKKYETRDTSVTKATAPSSLVKGRSFAPPKLPSSGLKKLSYDDEWGGSAEEGEAIVVKEKSRFEVSQLLLDGVASANAKAAEVYGSQVIRGENGRWCLLPMEKPATKAKRKKAQATDPSLLIATDEVPTAGYSYV